MLDPAYVGNASEVIQCAVNISDDHEAAGRDIGPVIFNHIVGMTPCYRFLYLIAEQLCASC